MDCSTIMKSVLFKSNPSLVKKLFNKIQQRGLKSLKQLILKNYDIFSALGPKRSGNKKSDWLFFLWRSNLIGCFSCGVQIDSAECCPATVLSIHAIFCQIGNFLNTFWSIGRGLLGDQQFFNIIQLFSAKS